MSRMNLRFPLRVVLAVVLALPLTGCLFRSHPAQVLLSNAPLQTATLEQLVSTINGQANKIHTLNSTVDIVASSGGSMKGKITEYKEVKGYILVRQPNMLRMIGLMPIIRNRILLLLSGKLPSELTQVDGKQKLVAELLLVARESLPEGAKPDRGIAGAFLSSFVIQ
jgi:hypothetical protein